MKRFGSRRLLGLALSLVSCVLWSCGAPITVIPPGLGLGESLLAAFCQGLVCEQEASQVPQLNKL